MDSDLLATMGIGGFGKQKKKPLAGPPPQQQARHEAARRPTAGSFLTIPVRPHISKFPNSATTSFTPRVPVCTISLRAI